MKNYAIVVEPGAESDLADIAGHIAEHYSVAKALAVMTKIEQAIDRLELFPNRGAHPKELLENGIRDFREVFFKPYRILYRVVDDKVVVVMIVDGRRDMRALLTRRLLGA
ncbi:MAG: type II toxin-antitoxin system RelE/ParE family toxin [Reyranella sp.]|nr:type II toxin-antitoxin system RelE/ParE family toxin [Reyranella sp.]